MISYHPSTNFKIQKYYQHKPEQTGICNINSSPKIKDETHIVNLGEYKSVRAYWIALYVNGSNLTYFDSFGIENIPKELTEKLVWNKNITANIRMQVHDLIILLNWFYWFFT